ncbi:MAG: hypothetical protein Q9223_007876, partial [Gallowayella weberi]
MPGYGQMLYVLLGKTIKELADIHGSYGNPAECPEHIMQLLQQQLRDLNELAPVRVARDPAKIN